LKFSATKRFRKSSAKPSGGPQDGRVQVESIELDKNVSDLKEKVFEPEELSKQTIKHVSANDIIMTFGRQCILERFLKFASYNVPDPSLLLHIRDRLTRNAFLLSLHKKSNET
jgi:hypothetical protein